MFLKFIKNFVILFGFLHSSFIVSHDGLFIDLIVYYWWIKGHIWSMLNVWIRWNDKIFVYNSHNQSIKMNLSYLECYGINFKFYQFIWILVCLEGLVKTVFPIITNLWQIYYIFLHHIHFLYGLCGEFHSFGVFHYILYLLLADKRESVEELQ